MLAWRRRLRVIRPDDKTPPMTGRFYIEVGEIRSVAKVLEGQRQFGNLPAQQGDAFLQRILFGPGDAHSVALNARRHLELAFLHQRDDLLRERLLDAVLDLDRLFQLVAGDLFGFSYSKSRASTPRLAILPARTSRT